MCSLDLHPSSCKATRRQLYQPTSPAPTASFPHGAGGTAPHAETFPQEAAISGRRWIAAEILVDVHHTGRASSRVSPGPHPGPKRSLATGGRLAARSGLYLSHMDQFLATPHCVGIWCNSTNPLDDLSIIIVGVCLSLSATIFGFRSRTQEAATHPCGHARVARSRVLLDAASQVYCTVLDAAAAQARLHAMQAYSLVSR